MPELGLLCVGHVGNHSCGELLGAAATSGLSEAHAACTTARPPSSIPMSCSYSEFPEFWWCSKWGVKDSPTLGWALGLQLSACVCFPRRIPRSELQKFTDEMTEKLPQSSALCYCTRERVLRQSTIGKQCPILVFWDATWVTRHILLHLIHKGKAFMIVDVQLPLFRVEIPE